ncbi:hypothetical protein YC2023_027934 [Brassica napus]
MPPVLIASKAVWRFNTLQNSTLDGAKGKTILVNFSNIKIEGKLVTHTRDTHEIIKLSKGLQLMLSIFKNYSVVWHLCYTTWTCTKNESKPTTLRKGLFLEKDLCKNAHDL